jgi:hypothetical protein
MDVEDLLPSGLTIRKEEVDSLTPKLRGPQSSGGELPDSLRGAVERFRRADLEDYAPTGSARCQSARSELARRSGSIR